MNNEEYVDLVDNQDRVVGTGSRKDCHGNPEMIHRAAHVFVFNTKGELLLQKRSQAKDIQPGKWDTSVGGHVDAGETYRQAAVRETYEELGIERIPLTRLYTSKIRNQIESENIETFLTVYDGPIVFAQDEIDEVRFWSAAEIKLSLATGCFTPNFEEEWQMFNEWLGKYQAGKGEKAFCAGDSFPDIFHQLNNE